LDEPFNVDTDKEIIISATGAAIGVPAIIAMLNTNQLTLDEIDSLNPQDVNAFDRIAIGPYESDVLGDALLYSSFLFPLSFLTYDKTREDFGAVALMYGEAVLLNTSINALVKALTLRNRPYVYDKNSLLEPKFDIEARYSFYSGHTSICAAASFFTAKVFSEYLEDETAKILIWSGAAILPAAMGLMRVNSHWHFPTDVIVGYAFGALVGYFVPELHKSNLGEDVSIYPSIDINRPALSLQIKF